MRALLVFLLLTALPATAQLPYGPIENIVERFSTDLGVYGYGEAITVYVHRYNTGEEPVGYRTNPCPPIVKLDFQHVRIVCPQAEQFFELAPHEGIEVGYTIYPDSLGFPSEDDDTHTIQVDGHFTGPTLLLVRGPQYLGGQVSVGIAEGASESEVQAVREALNTTVREDALSETWQIEGVTPEQAVAQYESSPLFEWFTAYRPHPPGVTRVARVVERDVLVSAATDRTRYLPDDTVQVAIAITNHSGRTISLDYGSGIEAFFTVDPGGRCTPCFGVGMSHSSGVGSGGRIDFETLDNGYNEPFCFRFVPAECGLEPGPYTLNGYAIDDYAPAVVPFTVLPPLADETEATPTSASLTAAPNPFAKKTTLSLTLPTTQRVEAVAYDVLGRRVEVLHEGPLGAGTYPFSFEAADLPTGLYVVRVTGDYLTLTQRVTRVR